MRRDNNFNLMRMVAAVSVLVSHAYPIAFGPGSPEPLEHVLGFSLGTLAVLTFFAISGFFISQSFHVRGSLIEFVVARILRIYPGLLLVILTTVILLGPTFTSLHIASYFSQRATFSYIPRNLALWHLQYDLPGVFYDNPYPQAVNGSLWTLVYEVGCYGMVIVLGILGLTARTRSFIGFLVVYALLYLGARQLEQQSEVIAHTARLPELRFLTLPFVVGMTFFHLRRYLPLRFPVLCAAAVITALSAKSACFKEIFTFTWTYGIFYFGFLRYKPILSYNVLGDYSYGMYVFAFPIEQIVAALTKGSALLAIIAWSFPMTLLLSVLSWHLLEERALKQRTRISAYLRRMVASWELAGR